MQRIILGVIVFILLLVVFVVYKRITNVADYVHPPENLKVTSTAFVDGGNIPQKYTGRGKECISSNKNSFNCT